LKFGDKLVSVVDAGFYARLLLELLFYLYLFLCTSFSYMARVIFITFLWGISYISVLFHIELYLFEWKFIYPTIFSKALMSLFVSFVLLVLCFE